MLEYRNLSENSSFARLSSLGPISLKHRLDETRIQNYRTHYPGGLEFFFSTSPIDERHLKLFDELKEEASILEQYTKLLEGAIANPGEGRPVLHQLSRGQILSPVYLHGIDQGAFYHEQHQKAFEFSRNVHSGHISGSNGKKFSTVVQIGIGGSDLGPRALYLALSAYAKKNHTQKLEADFISNVDPDDAHTVLQKLDLESTLFILVSKSGTTQETLFNELFVRKALQRAGLDDAQHFICVTSKTSPLAQSDRYLMSFFIDDYIGGRYSSTSCVGTVLLSLCFGDTTVEEILKGAHLADRTALETDLLKNPALLDAFIGIYYRNVLGYSAQAILPYSQALVRFPAHLQQADMESNGKSVNRQGEELSYPTGPLIFGEPGTNGQHSFYQWLHQGTDIVPLTFIGFQKSQWGASEDLQNKLIANLIAQMIAFGRGQDNENPNKLFTGERPSTLLWGKELSPFLLGNLLAHFENKIMFQGFLWNINSFDQEGVQLGKKLTESILKKDPQRDLALQALEKVLAFQSS